MLQREARAAELLQLELIWDIDVNTESPNVETEWRAARKQTRGVYGPRRIQLLTVKLMWKGAVSFGLRERKWKRFFLQVQFIEAIGWEFYVSFGNTTTRKLSRIDFLFTYLRPMHISSPPGWGGDLVQVDPVWPWVWLWWELVGFPGRVLAFWDPRVRLQ